MRLFLPLPHLVLFKILLLESRSSLEEERKTRMPRNTSLTGQLIRMISLPLISLEERTVTSSPLESAARCPLSTSGTQTQCLPSQTSVLEVLLRECLLFPSVLAKDMLLLLTSLTTTTCTSTTFRERRCSSPFPLDLTPFRIFSGPKNPMI